MKRLFFFLAVLLLGLNNLVAQETDVVKAAIDSIRKCNYLDYYDGWGPTFDPYYHILEKHADDQLLSNLARQHSIPVIRAVAGKLLIERNSKFAIPLVFDMLHDKSMFLICYGDQCENDNVANFLVNELFEKRLINEQDSLRLNDSLLYSPGLRHIKMRAQLMKNLFPDNQFYESVKRMYVEEHDGDALIMLARFGREEDTVYVLENLRKYFFPQEEWSWAYGCYYHHHKINLTDCALLAVAEWPHECFKPLLTEIRNSFLDPKVSYDMPRTRYFFSAVMAYRSTWALDMIEQTFDMIRRDPKDEPYEFYGGEGWYSHHYGESFDRTYQLDPDPYFDQLHEKYGRPSAMGW